MSCTGSLMLSEAAALPVRSFRFGSGVVVIIPCADPDGGRGSGPHLENYKHIGFLSNTGPDPLKITKLPSQYSMLGHHQLASETPFKIRKYHNRTQQTNLRHHEEAQHNNSNHKTPGRQSKASSSLFSIKMISK